VKLTPENKAHIDSLSYEELLRKWSHTPAIDPWFQDETGKYWSKRMAELRAEPGGEARHVAAAKAIGW